MSGSLLYRLYQMWLLFCLKYSQTHYFDDVLLALDLLPICMLNLFFNVYLGFGNISSETKNIIGVPKMFAEVQELSQVLLLISVIG